MRNIEFNMYCDAGENPRIQGVEIPFILHISGSVCVCQIYSTNRPSIASFPPTTWNKRENRKKWHPRHFV